MTKNLIIVLTFLLAGSVEGLAQSDGSNKLQLLTDGFALAGVDGKLITKEAGQLWFFKLDSDLSEDKNVVKAGSLIELLPSSALEKAIASKKERPGSDYRLWGQVTKYKDKNFIFPRYLLPLSKEQTPSHNSSQERTPVEQPQKLVSKQQSKLAINEPNDMLTMPEEVLDKLKTRKIIRTDRQRKSTPVLKSVSGPINELELERDSILADRTAVLVERSDSRPEFILDAIGRNVPHVSFQLLP
ncbi:unnamed protein product, partial [marine sediment metagenome]